MRDHYRARREQAMGILKSRDMVRYCPQGAFYLMVDTGQDSNIFARALLAERNVAVAPGAAFGAGARSQVRVALCVEADALDAGLSAVLDRIAC